MTPAQEFAEVLLDLDTWKPLDGDDLKRYRRALAVLDDNDQVVGLHFAPGVLLQAVRQLRLAGGSPFRPSPAELIEEAIGVQFPELSPVSWTEVWSAIRAARRHPAYPHAERSLAVRAEWVGQAVGAECGPIAASFAAATFGDLEHAPISGGERSGAAVGALRKEWDEYQRTVRERVLRGGRILTPAEVLRRGDRTPVLQPARQTPGLAA